MNLKILGRIADIPQAAWDTLVGEGSPFLEWGWLSALEESGCVAPDKGWLPQHLTLWDGDMLLGAAPAYLKGHSMGEFVFDQAWADLAHRSGLSYYPKLLAAVPFTPVSGQRLLCHPDLDRAVIVETLGEGLKSLCEAHELSSIHVNFCADDEAQALRALGFQLRWGYQFEWVNQGWPDFETFLGSLRSKRRRSIRRERKSLKDAGIRLSVHSGDQIDDSLIEPMFHLYMSTIDRHTWGRQYLTLELFQRIAQLWRERLCFIVAHRGETLVAGAFFARKGDTLYGRYWGCFEQIPFLHFGVCYYEAIELCLKQGIERLEAGAGGGFKRLRGFQAKRTQSAHLLTHPGLHQAIGHYLEEERSAIDDQLRALDARGTGHRKHL